MEYAFTLLLLARAYNKLAAHAFVAHVLHSGA